MEGLISRESIFLGAVFAGVAFLLTFIAGIVSGVSLGLILLRSFLFTVLLFLLGTALGVLLQKFVPDIWDSGSGAAAPVDEGDEAVYSPSSGGTIDMTVGETAAAREPGGSGNTLSMPEGDDEVDEAFQPAKNDRKNQVVGNYRIINDKKFPDDPEQYAKAVRTMLKKDD